MDFILSVFLVAWGVVSWRALEQKEPAPQQLKIGECYTSCMDYGVEVHASDVELMVAEGKDGATFVRIHRSVPNDPVFEYGIDNKSFHKYRPVECTEDLKRIKKERGL